MVMLIFFAILNFIRYFLYKLIYREEINFSNTFTDEYDKKVSYYCMLCGNKDYEEGCPKCGSKMKKAVF